jgi:hypothetical protein
MGAPLRASPAWTEILAGYFERQAFALQRASAIENKPALDVTAQAMWRHAG